MKSWMKYVVVLLLVVAAGIAGFLLLGNKKTELVKQELDLVKIALEKYNQTEGQYPESLHALADKKIVSENELIDPWGAEFIYVPVYKDPGKGKKKIVSQYMLSSSGPDRKSWTKDDVQ